MFYPRGVSRTVVPSVPSIPCSVPTQQRPTLTLKNLGLEGSSGALSPGVDHSPGGRLRAADAAWAAAGGGHTEERCS